MVRRNTRYLLIAAFAATFVFLRLLSSGGTQLPGIPSLYRLTHIEQEGDPIFPPNTANTVDLLRTTTPDNIVPRPDNETSHQSPELQTQQGPVEPVDPLSY